jgi:hypothetical protein
MIPVKQTNIDDPGRSILTVYSCQEHFSFSIYNPEEKGSFFYEELPKEKQSDAFSVFKEVFFEQSFFSLPFRKVWIMSHTPNFAFIPHAFYKDEYRERYIRNLFSDRQGMDLNNFVSSAGLTVLYQLSEDIYQFMLRSFSQPEFIHYSTPMISYFLKKSKKDNVCQMVVNLQENGLDIFCFSGETFLLGNYFSCKGLSDALYYILFVWKQLKFNQMKDCLLISGNAVFKKELTGKLALYIQQINFLSIFPEIHFDGIETDRIPFELAALSVCEL